MRRWRSPSPCRRRSSLRSGGVLRSEGFLRRDQRAGAIARVGTVRCVRSERGPTAEGAYVSVSEERGATEARACARETARRSRSRVREGGEEKAARGTNVVASTLRRVRAPAEHICEHVGQTYCTYEYHEHDLATHTHLSPLYLSDCRTWILDVRRGTSAMHERARQTRGGTVSATVRVRQ